MAISSLVVPVVGLATQPILARALGTDGRGELAAAVVPAALLGAVVTLGLPEALTFHVAKRPWLRWAALRAAALVTVLLGAVSLALIWPIAGPLSGGDASLERLIRLGGLFVPALLMVGLLKGVSIGLQQWKVVAVENLVSASLRLVLLLVLWWTGQLTTENAVMVIVGCPIVSGLMYLWVLVRRRHQESTGERGPIAGPLIAFGATSWYGFVASMFIAKTDQLLMAPLSSVRDLGLFTVANTVTDIPILLAMAVSNAVNGTNSKHFDKASITRISRLVTAVSAIGCAVLAATSPVWLVLLFGDDFRDALLPTLLLFLSAAVYAPGPIAAAGLSAAGKPAVRSAGYIVTLIVNVGLIFLLVPYFGVVGACVASIAVSAVQSAFMIALASRVMSVRMSSFLLFRREDVDLLMDQIRSLSRRIKR